MPFTLVHPLAALPFRKFKLPLSALIIGSMIPDFNYFILPDEKIGHTVLGQFYFCLPVGLVTFIIFHIFIKRPIIDLFPSSHGSALSQVKDIDIHSLKIFFLTVLSLLIGSFSHIIWDSFTHNDGFAVLKFPFLQMDVIETPLGTLKLFKLLQHGCSFVGVIVLYIIYNRWRRSVPAGHGYRPVLPNKFRYLLISGILVFSFVIAVIRGYLVESNIFYFETFRMFTGTAIRSFFPALEISLLLYGIVWTAYHKHNKPV